MTFTLREQASSIYTHVRDLGRGLIRGADMDVEHAARLGLCDQAVRIISNAVGSPRILYVEPDDAHLEQMRQHVLNIRADIVQRHG